VSAPREHSGVLLVTDHDADIHALPALEEVLEVLRPVTRWDHDGGYGVLRSEFADDNHLGRESAGRNGANLRRLHLVKEAQQELHRDILGDLVHEDEVEGDAVGAVYVSAVGVVPDSPGEAGDAEGAGVHVVSVGNGVPGPRVAIDLQHVVAPRRTGDGDGGGARGRAITCGGRRARQRISHCGGGTKARDGARGGWWTV
jgi:hypothetical protein